MMASQFSDASRTQMGQVMLEGVFEILGQAGTNAVLNLARLPQVGGQPPTGDDLQASWFHEITAIQLALEALYGRHGGQGVALRAGRAAAELVMRQHGEARGLKELNFRLLPISARIRQGLDILAALLQDLGGGQVRVTEDEYAWRWEISVCPLCHQRSSPAPACHFFVGLLQAFLVGVSGGKTYNVVESACRATGAPDCVFAIDKMALE